MSFADALLYRGPDAEQYKPSRFIETDEKTGERSYKTYNLFHFHAFNGGAVRLLREHLQSDFY